MEKEAVITVKAVDYGSDDYLRMVACRNAALRAPLGRVLLPEELARDVNYHHFAAFNEADEVVGTVLLDAQNAPCARARQVSVHDSARGIGVGTALMRHVEQEARERGLTGMILHARETAVPFYTRVGYVAEGGYFDEIGLPHILMRKLL